MNQLKKQKNYRNVTENNMKIENNTLMMLKGIEKKDLSKLLRKWLPKLELVKR